MEIKSTAIIGMGALGILYGSYIRKQCGNDAVCFVMDEKRAEKYKDTVVTCNGEEEQFQIVADSEAKPADLVIVAVKYAKSMSQSMSRSDVDYSGLHDALEVMRNCVGENTTIISVLNGISSEEIIGARYGMEKIIYTVAQGMDAMKFANALNYTRMGNLHIGRTKGCDNERFDALIRFFDAIKMPYVYEEDILYRMWGKFMLNVGINQTCMVYQTTYSGALSSGAANRTLIAAMREVIALANAEGVGLSEKDLNDYIEVIKTLKPDGTPSMGQDRINKRASEVELFAGTVIALAKKHGLYVPENEFLLEQVREIEKEYAVGK